MLLREVYYLYRTFLQDKYDEQNKKKLTLFFLKNIVNYAYKNNTFYKKLYDSKRFDPTSLKDIEDIKKIPIINKKLILSNYKDYIPKKNLKDYKILSTSGTTNERFFVYLDEEAQDYNNCIFIRSLMNQGYNVFDRLGFYWFKEEKNSSFNRFNLSKKILILPTYTPDKQMDLIKKNKVQYLYYFPFKLFEFANYYGKDLLRSLNIKRIFLTGEISTPKMRDFFREIFSCPITDNYGLTEFNIVAYQQNEEEGYKDNFDNSYLECIENPRFKEYKNLGNAVITSFSNFFMPLIRYNTEDIIDLKGNSLNRILGRKNYFLNIKKGYIHIGEIIDIMIDYSDIILLFSFEVKEKSFKINVVIKENFTETKKEEIILKVKKKLGKSYKISIHKKEHISFEKRGKLNILKNN